jgi:hypothetical protein
VFRSRGQVWPTRSPSAVIHPVLQRRWPRPVCKHKGGRSFRPVGLCPKATTESRGPAVVRRVSHSPSIVGLTAAVLRVLDWHSPRASCRAGPCSNVPNIPADYVASGRHRGSARRSSQRGSDNMHQQMAGRGLFGGRPGRSAPLQQRAAEATRRRVGPSRPGGQSTPPALGLTATALRATSSQRGAEAAHSTRRWARLRAQVGCCWQRRPHRKAVLPC